MRLLGVDFGFKRIGLAVGETDYGVVTPRPVLAASGALKTDAEAIARLAKVESVGAVVVGLPIEPCGEEGRMARICRTVAGHLEGHGFAVHLVDERMSSASADSILRDEGLKASQRRKRIDGEAAALILERFMNEA